MTGYPIYHCGVNILALDSSTEACSAALLREDGTTFSCFEIAPRQHNRLLPRMMDQVLSESGLDRAELTYCAYANGPGAFTGIRIATAQAQGVGLALGIPLLPISTLAVMAQASLSKFDCESTLVALDARMGEIYWAVYRRGRNGLAELQDEERLSPVASISLPGSAQCGAGHGWVKVLLQQAGFPVDPELLPDANSMLELAQAMVESDGGVSAEQAGINYLRVNVADRPGS